MDFSATLQVFLILVATIVATFKALVHEWFNKTMGVFSVLAFACAAFLVAWADKISVK